eukprot:TRINITY_DN8484_c0_g1_i1.p1 TRINITY_DN8484_c0_g1~~TRINITY_DN8484_c0_g1_i1.p1  ORF type:complete len:162 (+),score=26.93 TRINITY_DN8484_c0_g1_i1:61-546(+)
MGRWDVVNENLSIALNVPCSYDMMLRFLYARALILAGKESRGVKELQKVLAQHPNFVLGTHARDNRHKISSATEKEFKNNWEIELAVFPKFPAELWEKPQMQCMQSYKEALAEYHRLSKRHHTSATTESSSAQTHHTESTPILPQQSPNQDASSCACCTVS